MSSPSKPRLRRGYRVAFLFAFSTLLFTGCVADRILTATDDPGDTTLATGDVPGRGTEFTVTTPDGGGPNPLPGPFVIRGRNVHYDDDLGALVAEISLVNASEHTYRTPVALTFLDLLPQGVTILNADNEETGAGAAFRMPFEHDDGEWTPGEETEARAVQFGADPGVSIGFMARIDVEMEPGLGSIGGVVWNDLNENGVFEDGEPGLAGVTIHLGADGTDGRRTSTDAAGAFRFDGLAAGFYRVHKIPDGNVPTTPSEIAVLLTEKEGGVADFLLANFGCVADTEDSSRIEIGDWVAITGEYLPEPDRVVAHGIDVHPGPNDEPSGRGELRGPITAIAGDRNALAIMGTRTAFREGIEIQPPNQCGDRFSDLEVGENIRVRVETPENEDHPLRGTDLRCWNGSPDKIFGAVEAIRTDEEGHVLGFVVLRTAVVVTDRTEWGGE